MVTEENRKHLVEAARQARRNAYAPYSHYSVGAAVLAEDGRIFAGANVENASYGMTICAERAAVFAAISAGARRIEAVAVCSENAWRPCGACRQVLSEFADDLLVLICDGQSSLYETTLQALLPERFGPQDLK
jgi:cytidine deaminase